jgi:hypothetical protein
VNRVEQRALELEREARLELGELLRLQQDLSRLKTETLDKFAEGDLEGKELVAGFLAVVNDARNYLTRLTLHERDNLSEQARRAGRQVDEVWAEAVGRSGKSPQRKEETA